MGKLISMPSFVQLLAFVGMLTLSSGHVPFDFYVTGDNPIVTGIQNYTIGSSETATIVCSTSPFMPFDIIIRKNNTEVEKYSKQGTDFKEFSTSHSEPNEELYKCRIKFASTALESHRFLYSLEVELLLNTVENSSFCATNVGESGFIGEDVVLICNGQNNAWRPGGNSEIEVSLSRDEIYTVNTVVCRRNSQGRPEICRSHLQILPSLELQIITIPNGVNLGVLEFTCESTPPRLLYWRVWGKNGDILDLENYASYLEADTNITINQTAGETTLRISEAVPGGNGIYAVECFTYETMLKAASMRVEQQDGIFKLDDKNVVYITAIYLLVIVIIILVIIIFCMYYKIRKYSNNKREDATALGGARPTETVELPLELPAGTSYSSRIYHTPQLGDQTMESVNKDDKEYTYAD